MPYIPMHSLLAFVVTRGLHALSIAAHPLVYNPFLSASYISIAFIGPTIFCFCFFSIFASFSAHHPGWASARGFFSFHLIPLVSYAQLLPLLPSSRSSWSISLAFPFHYRLDTVFDSARGGDMHPRAVRNGVTREREEGRRGARGSSPHCSYVHLLMVSWSSRIRVRPQATRFVYGLLVLLLPLLGAAVQLTQIQRRRSARVHYCPRVVTPESSSCDLPFILPLPGSDALGMRAFAHRHPPEYLVLLRVSACLAHRVEWCRESSGLARCSGLGIRSS
jgi:hypothetical protein